MPWQITDWPAHLQFLSDNYPPYFTAVAGLNPAAVDVDQAIKDLMNSAGANRTEIRSHNGSPAVYMDGLPVDGIRFIPRPESRDGIADAVEALLLDLDAVTDAELGAALRSYVSGVAPLAFELGQWVTWTGDGGATKWQYVGPHPTLPSWGVIVVPGTTDQSVVALNSDLTKVSVS